MQVTRAALDRKIGAAGEPECNGVRYPNNGLRVDLKGGKVSEVSISPLAGKKVEYDGLDPFADDPVPFLKRVQKDGGPLYVVSDFFSPHGSV